MKTLYRAYRPQNFKEIVNQNHIKITLQHEIESGRVAHAYLFCGPRGIGKTTIARILAKSLNCQNRKEAEHEPCGVCDMCKDSSVGRNMDMIEVDAASHTGVDNVRENIISVSRIAPSRGKFKIFIIDEVHMLSISAFNALLKLLEEPPSHAIFVLCTTEVHKIPETIISRTERFDFKRISIKDVVKKLQYIISKEGIKVEKGVLENIARNSEGHMRDAESLLGQVVAIGGKEISKEEADMVIPRSDINEVLNLIEMLGNKDAGSAIGLVNKTLDEGVNLKRFISELLEILRKLMLTKIDPSLADKFGLELGESIELRMTEIGKKLEVARIVKMIDRLMRLQGEMKGAFIEQLPLELAIAEICLSETEKLQFGKANTPQPNATQAPRPAQPTQQANQANNPSSNISKNPPVVATKTNVDISKEQIMEKWNEVLAKIKKHNHSLSFILRACQPQELEGNQLKLAFKYKFHKERISEVSIKQMVENVILEVYGQSILIEPIVDESLKVENGQNVPVAPVQTGSAEDAVPPIEEENPSTAQAETQPASGNETKQKNDEDMLNNVLKTFGGKVV